MKDVYIKEFDCFGKEIDVQIKCDNWNVFLKVWDIETLKRLLQISIKQENYEMAELINNHIKLKSNLKT